MDLLVRNFFSNPENIQFLKRFQNSHPVNQGTEVETSQVKMENEGEYDTEGEYDIDPHKEIAQILQQKATYARIDQVRSYVKHYPNGPQVKNSKAYLVRQEQFNIRKRERENKNEIKGQADVAALLSDPTVDPAFKALFKEVVDKEIERQPDTPPDMEEILSNRLLPLDERVKKARAYLLNYPQGSHTDNCIKFLARKDPASKKNKAQTAAECQTTDEHEETIAALLADKTDPDFRALVDEVVNGTKPARGGKKKKKAKQISKSSSKTDFKVNSAAASRLKEKTTSPKITSDKVISSPRPSSSSLSLESTTETEFDRFNFSKQHPFSGEAALPHLGLDQTLSTGDLRLEDVEDHNFNFLDQPEEAS